MLLLAYKYNMIIYWEIDVLFAFHLPRSFLCLMSFSVFVFLLNGHVVRGVKCDCIGSLLRLINLLGL